MEEHTYTPRKKMRNYICYVSMVLHGALNCSLDFCLRLSSRKSRKMHLTNFLKHISLNETKAEAVIQY